MRIFILLGITAITLTVEQPAAFAQPAALAELFSSFGCGNCPGPDSAYGVYISKHPGVILINYHNATADQFDKFFLDSYPASKDRDYLYGGGGPQNNPSASIDGFTEGSLEGNWETVTNAALTNTLPATISAEVGHGPNGIDTISFTVSGGPSGKQVAYGIAIKESRIYYANNLAYGNPPDSLWNDIFRAMLPKQGSIAFGLGGTNHFTEIFDPSQYSFTMDEQNLTAVIFVQDKSASAADSYQIEGLDTVSLASPSAVSESEASSNRLIIPENPVPPQGHIAFELASSGTVQLTLSDLLGRPVRTLVDGRMPSGETSVELSESGIAAGCYIARLTVDGRGAGEAMLILAP